MAKVKQQRIDPRKVAAAARSGKRAIPPQAKVKPATASDWIAGARLRTLPLAISPVVLGTAAAYFSAPGEGWHWVRALLCLAIAVFLQVGVNFANDYSDGIRGTDRNRVGPARLTGSGAAKPATVRAVAIFFLGLGALAGLAVIVLSAQWWLLAVGAAAIAAAWFYTGGKHPYGYYGLGELFVFIFFGLVATAGTMLVQVGTVTFEAWLLAIAAGLFACSVLVANNMRDLEQDRLSGKRTLSVLIGMTASRVLFTVLVLAPFGILVFFALLFVLAKYVFFALLIAVPAALIACTGKTAPEFLLVLKLASLTSLVFALGLAAAIVF